MSNLKQFPLSPNYKILQRLVNGALNQSQNLTTAMRRWALINWFFYGDSGENADLRLNVKLTFNECIQHLFEPDHPQGQFLEKVEFVSQHNNIKCRCNKTTQDWLNLYDFAVDEWQQELEANLTIPKNIIAQVLQERLFAKTRRTLQTDINFLKQNKILEEEYSLSKKQKVIYPTAQLPAWFSAEASQESQLSQSFKGLNNIELADLAQALEMLSFLDPKLDTIAEKLSQEISRVRRVFLHVDYVVPEEIQHDVDDLQEIIQENWRKEVIKPMLFNYHSARLGKKECLVYPVCIYYVQRAKYLCAYGISPNSNIGWYNYRLERVKFKDFLDWSDTNIPEKLLSQYKTNSLPQPEYIQNEMQKVWGFDFYNDYDLMLLRFKRDFHDSHIKNTFRHETFTPIKSQEKLVDLIKNHTKNSSQEKELMKIIQRCPDDAYYTAKYRLDDNNVIMRLRAWGAKVEVLFPTDLRSRIAKDIQEATLVYYPED